MKELTGRHARNVMNTEREYHEQLTVRLDTCFRQDARRLNWLEGECRAGRVQLLINHVPRGVGNTVRAAIDDARQANTKLTHD